MTFHMNPVGSVRNARTDPGHIRPPGRVLSTIMIDERFGEDCLTGLADFSHVEVLFILDQASERDDYRQRAAELGVVRIDSGAFGIRTGPSPLAPVPKQGFR